MVCCNVRILYQYVYVHTNIILPNVYFHVHTHKICAQECMYRRRERISQKYYLYNAIESIIQV